MKKCFFVTPIGESDSEERRDSDFVLKHFLEPDMSKLDFKVLRADLINTVERIDDTVIQQLNESELVIVDVTRLNPNVMFEFGIRYGLEKPFIVISQNLSNMPFDIRNIRILEYTVTAPDIDAINSKLEAMILIALDNETNQDSPLQNTQEKLGEEMALNAIQTGDFSQIENVLDLMGKLGIDPKNL